MLRFLPWVCCLMLVLPASAQQAKSETPSPAVKRIVGLDLSVTPAERLDLANSLNLISPVDAELIFKYLKKTLDSRHRDSAQGSVGIQNQKCTHESSSTLGDSRAKTV